PYIPGSSLKGAIRSHVSSLLMAFQQGGQVDLACDQDYEGRRGGTACVSVSDVNTWRQQSPAQLDNLITGQLCLACRVLGSPWMASKVKIQDAPVRPDTWHRYIIRDGVAIDRDKGTAADGFKYDYEVVPAGAR